MKKILLTGLALGLFLVGCASKETGDKGSAASDNCAKAATQVAAGATATAPACGHTDCKCEFCASHPGQTCSHCEAMSKAGHGKVKGSKCPDCDKKGKKK